VDILGLTRRTSLPPNAFPVLQIFQNCFAAIPAPLGELTALPRSSSWVLGHPFVAGRGRNERKGEGREGKGEDRKKGDGERRGMESSRIHFCLCPWLVSTVCV